jgi:uncharacterized protein with von Willebrand factor type A (vWA) domain
MGKSFNFKSVLNTDLYDKMSFEKIYGLSKPLQKVAERQDTPAFPHLLGDVWSSLYKLKPHVKAEDVHPSVSLNKSVMQRVLQEETFHQLRETTKLDEMASAIGTLHLKDSLEVLLDDPAFKQANELSQQAKEQQEAVQELEQMLQQWLNEGVAQEEVDALQEQIVTAQQQAMQSGKSAEKNMQQAMDGKVGKGIQEAIAQAAQQTKQDVEQVEKLLSGLGYGSRQAEIKKLPLRDRLMLAEKLRNSKKLKEVAELTGRMKAIAKKKQRSKSKESVGRADITYGNDMDQLTSTELLLYTRKETKLDFLQRFAEGKVIQYAPQAKEKLGKGPIVGVIDTSGSMEKLDNQAKAILLALLAIAKKQHRAFGVVNFSSAVRTWSFPKGNPSTSELMDVIETFHDGGTDFELALSSAMNILESSTYDKGDVVFITDGDSYVDDSFLRHYREMKIRMKFQILSIQLGYEKTDTLKLFSDQVVKAASLFEAEVTEKVFNI